MNEFRQLAAKMDQHMQQLSAQGVNDAPAIINRMMGYVPDLHKIWVGTTDDQLIALFQRIPRLLSLRPHHGRGVRSRTHQAIAAL